MSPPLAEAAPSGSGISSGASSLQELRAIDNVNTVEFVPDGTRLVARTSDGSVQSWRVADGIQLMVLKAHDFGVTALDVAPDGRTGAWASIDETVQLWDPGAANHSNQPMMAFLAAVLAAILIAIGSAFAIAPTQGNVRL